MKLTYTETLNYLYERLPMFSRVGKPAMKPGLDNTIRLCNALGNPQNNFKCVHIAGTNGKGSTSHMLAAVLQQAGYKTGLYTSPHLIDFRERIKINGNDVSEAWVIDFVEKNIEIIEEVKPSFFEITVAMAFDYFAEQQVDIAIIETGLGGRLDSTNIITPLLSVITNISYDHMDLLGDTLPQIAYEKAGIIKPQVPVVIGERNAETDSVFTKKALQENSKIVFAEDVWKVELASENNLFYNQSDAVNLINNTKKSIVTDLKGKYQIHNIATALTVLDIINEMGFNISANDIFHSLGRVKKLTGLRGRWEVLQQSPLVIADVAHNAAGIEEVMKQWQGIKAERKFIVTGFVSDKDVSKTLSLFPNDSIYHFCNADNPRALPAAELKNIATTLGLKGEAYPSVEAAVESALNAMQKEDVLLITGSFYIMAEALKMF